MATDMLLKNIHPFIPFCLYYVQLADIISPLNLYAKMVDYPLFLAFRWLENMDSGKMNVVTGERKKRIQITD